MLERERLDDEQKNLAVANFRKERLGLNMQRNHQPIGR
jgi:hypothetical protein